MDWVGEAQKDQGYITIISTALFPGGNNTSIHGRISFYPSGLTFLKEKVVSSWGRGSLSHMCIFFKLKGEKSLPLYRLKFTVR